MSPHVKKLIGTLLTLLWLVIYCAVAMGIGVRLLPQAGALLRFVYYALAGTLWIIPVGLLLPWMYRDKRR
jgi:hypothetical protein